MVADVGAVATFSSVLASSPRRQPTDGRKSALKKLDHRSFLPQLAQKSDDFLFIVPHQKHLVIILGSLPSKSQHQVKIPA
jgi:hypothetical protein